MNKHIPLLRRAKASWLYPIYVPSYSRAGSAPLLELLAGAKPVVQRKVHIVVRTGEVKEYQRAYPWATIVREGIPGIGPARMRCLIDAERRGYDNIVVLDDDITHLSLLERITREDGTQHSRRHSSRISGIREPNLLVLSLATGCRLASEIFDMRPDMAYGSTRTALFSGDKEPERAVLINQAGFPCCVMFFDVARFRMREMPKPYHYHGEDLAMFLDTLSEGQESFILNCVVHDQHGSIETTIPLDPLDEVGRRNNLESAEHHYPNIYPFLRVSLKNKLGGVMRIGVNWNRWYKATQSEPVDIPLDELVEEI